MNDKRNGGSGDGLRYDRMVERALRGVVRSALEHAGQQGLHGNHHFYLTFRTHFPGVVIPDYLRNEYPETMTIVLQHQYWGLEVTPEWFAVTLSFRKVHERLTIPFEALAAFADPSVNFALQFDLAEQGRGGRSALGVREGGIREAQGRDQHGRDGGGRPATALRSVGDDSSGDAGEGRVSPLSRPGRSHSGSGSRTAEAPDAGAAHASAQSRSHKPRQTAKAEEPAASAEGAQVVSFQDFRKK